MHNPYASGGMPMQGSNAPPGSAMDQILYYQQQSQAQQQMQHQMQMMHHRHQIQQTGTPPSSEPGASKEYLPSGDV